MARELAFPFPLEQGLHARPASLLREAARRVDARAVLWNDRSGRSADCTSVIALMGTETEAGDPCRIVIDGPGEAAAASALGSFVSGPLARCDDALPAPAVVRDARPLPRLLVGGGRRILRGSITSPGVAIGFVHRVSGWAPPATEAPESPVLDTAGELERARAALRAVAAQIESDLRRAPAGVARDLSRAHLDMLGDADLERRIAAAIADEGASARRAIIAIAEEVASGFDSSSSRYIRERAVDVRELAARLVATLDGRQAGVAPLALSRRSIVVAERLGPSQLLGADRSLLAGLIVPELSGTAHVAILARSFGIPCLGCDGESLALLGDGTEVVLDARRGLVLLAPDDEERAYYSRDRAAWEGRLERARVPAGHSGRTRDFTPLSVMANVSSADEAISALATGADGIGLFRTEMLFLDRPSPPTEDEQCEAYSRVIEAAHGRPVVFRTLDVGGDKPLNYVEWPPEANPALGLRGARVYRRHPNLVAPQLRALARAARTAPVKVMFPMVASAAEMREMRALAERACADLGPDGGSVETGAMIEVPAAALSVRAMAREAAFFSVGTNDLLQYLTATDRTGDDARSRLDPRQPPLWRLLDLLVEAAHHAGRPVGVCGELAGDPNLLPLLVGLGVDSLSLAPPGVAAVKRQLERIDRASCRALLDRVIDASDSAEVQALLDEHARASIAEAPLVAASLVRLDSEAWTKGLVIKDLVDLLDVDERVTDAAAVEEAVWAREDSVPTAVGFGFAIPHCRTSAVRHPSIAMVRTRTAVPWAVDEEARLALLLAVPDASAGQHLRHLATLARRLAHEEFREALFAARDATEAAAILASAVGG